MKRKSIIISVALLLASSLTFQSCIGSFSLTNKVLTWNKNVNNKFVNELVFFVFWVLPVYEVTAIADLLVINSIEFWSGNKPLEANKKVIRTEHGDYMIHASECGYTVVSPDGRELCFAFDSEEKSWSFSQGGEEKTEFLRFKDNDHVEIINARGEFVDVELTREGVDKFVNGLGMPMMAFNGL